MIYENCAKYIYEELDKRYSVEEWKEQKIIIFGMDSLSETIISYFDYRDITNIILVDDRMIGKRNVGERWGTRKIENSIDFLFAFNQGSNISIIVSTKENYLKIAKKIIGINEKLKSNILDFSAIRMNTLPNTIKISDDIQTAELRECQFEIYEVLKKFAVFCEKNQLRYYLDYGTLLGAVRHRGFIPWDDDADVCMPWPDYLKFCDLYQKKGSKEVFFDSMWNETSSALPVSTLSKLKSKKIVTETHSFPLRMISGMALDIFPLCGYPTDSGKLYRFYRELEYLTDRWKKEVVIPYHTEHYSEMQHRKLWKEMLEFSEQYDYEKSDFIGSAYFGYDNYKPEGTRIMPKTWYEDSVELFFEKRMFSSPIGYKNILKKNYGDYMQFPPENERVPHDSRKLYKVLDYAKYE